MGERMRAAVCVGPNAIELRDWPIPAPGAGELLLRVRGCGLCGSDIVKALGPRQPRPTVLGHEVVGEVVAAGAGVSRFAPGERIVVAHHVPCFRCHYCLRGSPSMCRHFRRLNLDPGGFAEFVRVPADNARHAAFAIPAGMEDEAASFTEPLACCLRAVRRTGLGAGDTALVVGLGSVGCLMAQAFSAAGASAIGWDVAPARRDLARSLGVPAPASAEAVEACLVELSEGRGADAVILTAGGAAVLPWAVARVRDGGAVHVFAGGPGESLPLSLDTLYHRELTLSATYSSAPQDLARAFDLLTTGAVRVDGLITHRLPLEEVGRGVDLMRAQQAVKVYITP
jgi:L-iditol 2-dehydrogenase